MIVHVLRFSFKDGVSPAEQAGHLAALQRLVEVDSVAFSVIGQDLGDGSDGYTHTYCLGWENLDAMLRYIDNPEHPAIVSSFMTGVERITSVDFSDDMSPALAVKFEEMRQERAHKPDPAQTR